MDLIDRRTLAVLFTSVVFIGLVALLYAARRTLTALIFAVLFAYLLEPAIGAMERFTRGSRNKAIGSVYLMLVVFLTVFFMTVGPRAVREGQKWSEMLPTLLNNVSSGQIAWTFGEQRGWSFSTRQHIGNFLANHQNDIIQIKDAGLNRVAGVFSNAAWVLLVPIFAAFILVSKSELSRSVVELIETSHEREFLRNLLSDLDVMLAGYIRAQLLLSLLAASAYTIFLLLARLPYALAVGIVCGMLEFIPMVGPLIGVVIILGTAVATGYGHWILLACFWAIWRGIQDYVIMPHLVGRELKLHPLLTISAVLIGGEVAGVLGMFLSIPAVAAVRVIWDNALALSRRTRPQQPRSAA